MRHTGVSFAQHCELNCVFAAQIDRAKLYGWRDADHLQQVQYAADLADSTNGIGAGLDWGPGNLPSCCPPATYFLPVPGEHRGTIHRSFGSFARNLVNIGERMLNSSDAYRILGIQNSVSHRTNRALFREEVGDRQEARERFTMKLRSCYFEEQQNLKASRRMWGEIAHRNTSRLWRKARIVLVLAILWKESKGGCSDRSDAFSCLTFNVSHEDDDLAITVIQLLSSPAHPSEIADALVSLAPPIRVWERAAVNLSARVAFSCSIENEDGGAAVALLNFYSGGVESEQSKCARCDIVPCDLAELTDVATDQ